MIGSKDKPEVRADSSANSAGNGAASSPDNDVADNVTDSTTESGAANNATDEAADSTGTGAASPGGIDPIPPRYRRHKQIYRDLVIISNGGDPYKTKTIQEVVFYIVWSTSVILIAAGAVFPISNSALFGTLVGLALLIYMISFSYDWEMVWQAFKRYLKN